MLGRIPSVDELQALAADARRAASMLGAAAGLEIARRLGWLSGSLHLVGIEGESFDHGTQLSPAVAAAEVPRAPEAAPAVAPPAVAPSAAAAAAAACKKMGAVNATELDYATSFEKSASDSFFWIFKAMPSLMLTLFDSVSSTTNKRPSFS